MALFLIDILYRIFEPGVFGTLFSLVLDLACDLIDCSKNIELSCTFSSVFVFDI